MKVFEFENFDREQIEKEIDLKTVQKFTIQYVKNCYFRNRRKKI